MDSSRLESLFRELEQVEHLAGDTGEHDKAHLGLGLAVAAHAIKQMNGQLRVDSKPGLGSTFVCLIPFNLVRRRASYSSNESLLSYPYGRDSTPGGGNSAAGSGFRALSGTSL